MVTPEKAVTTFRNLSFLGVGIVTKNKMTWVALRESQIFRKTHLCSKVNVSISFFIGWRVNFARVILYRNCTQHPRWNSRLRKASVEEKGLREAGKLNPATEIPPQQTHCTIPVVLPRRGLVFVALMLRCTPLWLVAWLPPLLPPPPPPTWPGLADEVTGAVARRERLEPDRLPSLSSWNRNYEGLVRGDVKKRGRFGWCAKKSRGPPPPTP